MSEHELEASLEAFFRKRVRLLGGYVVKMIATERGVPDRLVFFPGGRMYLVELKREGEDLSPIQRVWHNKLRGYGTRVTTLHGREEILTWLAWVVDTMGPRDRKPGRPSTKVS